MNVEISAEALTRSVSFEVALLPDSLNCPEPEGFAAGSRRSRPGAPGPEPEKMPDSPRQG